MKGPYKSLLDHCLSPSCSGVLPTPPASALITSKRRMLIPLHTAQFGSSFNYRTGFFLKFLVGLDSPLGPVLCDISSLLMDRIWVSRRVRMWGHLSYTWLSRLFLTKEFWLEPDLSGNRKFPLVCEKIPGTQAGLTFSGFWFSVEGIVHCAKVLSILAECIETHFLWLKFVFESEIFAEA